jgi:hypothetical protein
VCPFQFEVGMADLAIGATACIAFWRDLGFKAAAVSAASIFLLVGRFDDYFLPQEQWAFWRETFFQRSGLPSDHNEVAGYLKKRMNRAYDLFLQTAPGNSYASVDEDGWCLSVDNSPEKPGKEADEKLDRLKSWLGRHMRTTHLTDTLIEVDNDIRFTDHFLPPAQKGKRDRKEICTILALCLAMVATSGWEQWPI